jgi:hypothetical protein
MDILGARTPFPPMGAAQLNVFASRERLQIVSFGVSLEEYINQP